MKPDPPILRSHGVMDAGSGTPAAPPGSASEEADWVRRAREGDEDAYRRLVERHADAAYGLAFRILRSREEAQEAAQDAFLRAWRALAGFRGEARFGTWLHRIVVRRALDRAAALRRRANRETAVEDPAALPLPDPGAPPGEGALRERWCRRLLDELSDEQRAVVALYYLEDRSVKEIAGLLERPEGTVKTHLHRARAALRRRWARAIEGAGD